MRRADDLLMLEGVSALCSDCGVQRVFVPVEDSHGEFCCTTCDAAVFLLPAVGRSSEPRRRVA